MTYTNGSVPYAESGLKAGKNTHTNGNTGTIIFIISVHGIAFVNMTGKKRGDRLKTLIAVPCYGSIDPDFMKCMLELEKPEGTSFAIIKNTLIYNARNTIAQNAIEYGFDRVLWFDADILFKPDTLLKLSADMDKGYDFISGVYFMKTDKPKPVVYSDVWYKVTDNEASAGATHVVNLPDRIFECAGAGFGCVMTSVSLLKKMVEKYGAPFTPMMGVSEDLSFCWRAKQDGFALWCDGRIRCGHIGSFVYRGDGYD